MKKWISIVLFNIYLECIMQDSLQGHHTSMSEGGQSVTCTDNIDLTAGSNSELQKLLDELTAFMNTCSVEISTEKSKVTVNTTRSANVRWLPPGQAKENLQI